MIKKKEVQSLTKQIETMQEQKEIKNLYTDTSDKTMSNLYEVLNDFLLQQKKRENHEVETKRNYQQMLANISHDLKTPLTVIKGLSELIDLENKTQDENQQLLLKIQEKVQVVQNMMDSFFALNKIEADDYPLKLQKMNLVESCKKILLEFYDIFALENIMLDIDFPESPVYVALDEAAFARILNNLLSNALKYGKDGKVVGCRIKPKKDSVQVSVWDKGKGIEEKYYHQIFERLFTLEDSRNKNYSGSGLGLTITKRLIKKHQGTIYVTSTPYVYTEFIIELPILDS